MKDLYLIPDLNNIEKSLYISEKYNTYFEYNDFFKPSILDDNCKIEKIIDMYKSLKRDRTKDTLHGAFFDITIFSSDKKIKEVSEHRVKQCLDIAKELDINAVIFHTNYMPGFKSKHYLDNWIEKNYHFWNEMLLKYTCLNIYMENMFDDEPYLLYELAKKMENNNRFGICFDFAHANLTNIPINDWVDKLYKFIKHIHINDNDGISDLHNEVGNGSINWKDVNNLINKYKISPSTLIEVNSAEKQELSIEYMRRNKIYPLN